MAPSVDIFLHFYSWEKYSPCGSQIPETPFVAFKVPLSEVSHFKNNIKINLCITCFLFVTEATHLSVKTGSEQGSYANPQIRRSVAISTNI